MATAAGLQNGFRGLWWVFSNKKYFNQIFLVKNEMNIYENIKIKQLIEYRAEHEIK